ncbi:MAG: ABC transporter permease [Syntrophobacteraceae bacterium]
MESGEYVIHIKPRKSWQLFDRNELLEYRDLLYFLVLRDIKVKYKQTVLGGLWAIIQPLFSMIIFTLFFGKLAKIPSDGIPYPLFNFSAMILWTYFANSISGAGNSLVGNSNLLSKVYFPRLIIPLAPVLAGLLDFVIALILLLAMGLYYGISPSITLISLPAIIVLMVMAASGAGVFLAALNAKYRDIRYAIPFLVQLWMFASPIVYPTSLVPERFRLLFALNPMTGIIEGFRSAFLENAPFPWSLITVSAAVSLALLCLGLLYFRKTERYFADII